MPTVNMTESGGASSSGGGDSSSSSGSEGHTPIMHQIEQCLVHGGRRLRAVATVFVTGAPGLGQLAFRLSSVKLSLESQAPPQPAALSLHGTDSAAGSSSATAGLNTRQNSVLASPAGAVDDSAAALQERDLVWPVTVTAGVIEPTEPIAAPSAPGSGAGTMPSAPAQAVRYYGWGCEHTRVEHGREAAPPGVSLHRRLAEPRVVGMRVAYSEDIEVADDWRKAGFQARCDVYGFLCYDVIATIRYERSACRQQR